MIQSSTEKRNESHKRKLVQLLRRLPGTLAANIPVVQRRFLAELERQGIVECRIERDAFRWYVVPLPGYVRFKNE
jgi:hypothetical protein